MPVELGEDVTARRFDDHVAGSDSVVCLCEACEVNRKGRHSYYNTDGIKLKKGVVHEYSHKPNWRLMRVPGDTFKYYLGVELETDNPDGTVMNDESVDFRRPKNFWFAKHDGSVSGPEFVSQPATFTYWKREKKKVAEMLMLLRHAGLRSHDGGNAGMHVSISRAAFDSREHLLRFLAMIYAHPNWTLKMSQRTRSQVDHWAKLDVGQTSAQRFALCDEMYDRAPMRRGRYVALNAPYREERFEFRIPRGTLRLDRFYKNLEWVVAMAEYSRGVDIAVCNPIAFTAWVMAKRGTYPNLASFILERMDALEAAAGVVVASGDSLPVMGIHRQHAIDQWAGNFAESVEDAYGFDEPSDYDDDFDEALIDDASGQMRVPQFSTPTRAEDLLVTYQSAQAGTNVVIENVVYQINSSATGYIDDTGRLCGRTAVEVRAYHFELYYHQPSVSVRVPQAFRLGPRIWKFRGYPGPISESKA
jgi:hypothetical protein